MKYGPVSQQIGQVIKTGVIRGTQALHTLPSFLVTLSERETQNIGRTTLENILGTLTFAAELSGYLYLQNNYPSLYLVPAVTNTLDSCGYFLDKLRQGIVDNDSLWFGPPVPTGFDFKQIDWTSGAGFESFFPSLYH